MLVKRAASLAVLVVALVVGLLGMHTLAGGHSEHQPVAEPFAMHLDPAESQTDHCASCGDDSGYSAIAATCVLALLFLVTVFRLPRCRLWFVLPRAVRRSNPPRAPGALVTSLTAPSLIRLGISRT